MLAVWARMQRLSFRGPNGENGDRRVDDGPGVSPIENVCQNKCRDFGPKIAQPAVAVQSLWHWTFLGQRLNVVVWIVYQVENYLRRALKLSRS